MPEEEIALEVLVDRVRVTFVDDNESDDLAQVEAMVSLGSGVFEDEYGRPGDQLLLVSPTGCTNYWQPGPEHGAEEGSGAYAPLVPGVEDGGVGSLRAAARALVEHDLRVAAGMRARHLRLKDQPRRVRPRHPVLPLRAPARPR